MEEELCGGWWIARRARGVVSSGEVRLSGSMPLGWRPGRCPIGWAVGMTGTILGDVEPFQRFSSQIRLSIMEVLEATLYAVVIGGVPRGRGVSALVRSAFRLRYLLLKLNHTLLAHLPRPTSFIGIIVSTGSSDGRNIEIAVSQLSDF